MAAADIPSKYTLGGTVELRLTSYDTDNVIFTPTESRLSIKEPTGNIVTVSGDQLLTASGGYLYHIYRPPIVGWYEYEGWVKDNSGREIVKPKGFDIVDRLY
jgi:hypothetical protein